MIIYKSDGIINHVMSTSLSSIDFMKSPVVKIFNDDGEIT